MPGTRHARAASAIGPGVRAVAIPHDLMVKSCGQATALRWQGALRLSVKEEHQCTGLMKPRRMESGEFQAMTRGAAFPARSRNIIIERRLQPFAGPGVGMVRHRIREKRIDIATTATVVPAGTRTDAARLAEPGSAVRLNEDATLDISRRHTDLGEAGTGQ